MSFVFDLRLQQRRAITLRKHVKEGITGGRETAKTVRRFYFHTNHLLQKPKPSSTWPKLLNGA
jgi:hypothetical protein